MIRLKITNKSNIYDYPNLRRSFSGLIRCNELLRDYSIFLVDSGPYEYELIDKSCFSNRKTNIKESVNMGLEFLSNKKNDYFLFDGGDDTGLLGIYEVFKESNACGLFKHQILSQEDYKKTTFLGKWWRYETDTFQMNYDIPNDIWDKINLSGYNLGHVIGQLTSNVYNVPKVNKDIDVFAIWKSDHHYNEDYGFQNWRGYKFHRNLATHTISKLKNTYKIVTGNFNSKITRDVLCRSKIGISPFGQGELCFRDFEIVQNNALLIKPNISMVKTKPNWLIENETYIPCKIDFSDLNEIVSDVLSNYKKYEHIIINAKEKMLESYKLQHVCEYWNSFFKNIN